MAVLSFILKKYEKRTTPRFIFTPTKAKTHKNRFYLFIYFSKVGRYCELRLPLELIEESSTDESAPAMP